MGRPDPGPGPHPVRRARHAGRADAAPTPTCSCRTPAPPTGRSSSSRGAWSHPEAELRVGGAVVAVADRLEQLDRDGRAARTRTGDRRGERRTRRVLRLVLLVALLTTAVAWIGLQLWFGSGHALPGASWGGAVLIVFMAVGVYCAGLPIRRFLRGEATRPLSPLRAMRTLVLAQAAALTGALVAGWYAAQALVLLPDADVDSVRAAMLRSLAVCVSGVLMIVAGLLVQAMCRIDDQDRDQTVTTATRTATWTATGPPGPRQRPGPRPGPAMMGSRSHRPVALGLAALLVIPVTLRHPQRQHRGRRRRGRAGRPALSAGGPDGPGSSGASGREREQQRAPRPRLTADGAPAARATCRRRRRRRTSSRGSPPCRRSGCRAAPRRAPRCC